jgi:Carboxypeptidase regulatory-like domain
LKAGSSFSIALACALLGSATAPAFAQTVALGAIVSSVRDTAGNPVGGALVVATGPTTREATTNSAGIVTLLGLPAGTYSVRVTRSGFEPFGTVATIGSQADGIKILNLHVSPDTFADSGSAEMGATSTRFDTGNAPYVTPELTAALAANVLPAQSVVTPLALPALALEGTRPGETRVELDGIPLAGGAVSGAALRFRSALDLTGVTFVEGPSLSTPSLEDAIGGIVDYRTARISKTFTSDFDLGYDSTFGAFQHALTSDTFGKFGVLVDAVTGDGDNTSATAKAQLTLSRATSIDVAAYEAHAATTESDTNYADDAPAFSAGLRTSLGSGTLQGRMFSSDSDTTVQVGSAPEDTESWRSARIW